MDRASALRLRAEVGFSGQKLRLAHAFVVILRPPFLFTAVNLARRYALVALIVVKRCKSRICSYLRYRAVVSMPPLGHRP